MIGTVLVAQETATWGAGAFPPLPGWLVVLLLGTVGIWLMLPVRRHRTRIVGAILSAAAAVWIVGRLLPQNASLESLLFWALAGLTVGSAVAMITARKPVYSAIWFAAVLLGTAGLLMINGAQFLGVATLAVYAGAIVVTFLFVLMLAQPEGESFYDRISWGPVPAALGTFAGMAVVVVLSWSIAEASEVMQSLPGTQPGRAKEVLAEHHVATLGRHLFSVNLLAVEVAGLLLLAALVGAIVMAEHGNATVAELRAKVETSALPSEPSPIEPSPIEPTSSGRPGASHV